MFRAFFYSVNTRGWSDHAFPVTNASSKGRAFTSPLNAPSGGRVRKFKRLRHQTKDAIGILGERRS